MRRTKNGTRPTARLSAGVQRGNSGGMHSTEPETDCHRW